jgi:hypothetical protein
LFDLKRRQFLLDTARPLERRFGALQWACRAAKG